ncbi:uncharacterized protein HMPREF1541_00540 [Cyphellophora europaea CBS 101466]|uniref:Uncharacterized protein n=1 Tax=Cyphellophora europaea (strain CBS 101466) TaxID=1220924 RepID=W2SCA9_CYPE1|nr:uncharacterized protein HMPREF1541_00540 [Cyphellophora europaea CBS 101466]ETN46356.1 hypothetical protein HMPREF1541_00540 [Cyphellophora europaea CBS 101466]
MFANAILSTIGFAALVAAAPQAANLNDPLLGVYICPNADWAAGDGVGCVWLPTSNNETTCQTLPRFTMTEEAERHISFTPDINNFCTIFESGRCNKTQPMIDVVAPGFHDLFEKHQVMQTRTQYKTYMCSTGGAAAPVEAANV